MLEGWSILYICGALFVGAVVWTSHLESVRSFV
jgi:hypothetical protein